MSLSQSERSGNAIAPPEPDLTPDEIVCRAQAMAPRLIELQAETEERTYYSEETHKAFDEAGFYRILHPRRYGGYEFGVDTFVRVVIELTRACPSTGWQFCLGAHHVQQAAAFWGERAQEELLSTGNFICPSTGAPQGVLERTADGWVLNGTYSYCSGAPYATHFMGHAMIPPAPDAPEGTPPRVALFIVDRNRSRRWTMLDDWGGQLGLKGSGSHSIQIEDAHIPDHHVLQDITLRNLKPKGETPGLRLHGNTLYRGSWFGATTLEGAALAVGMALGAQDAYGELMGTKRTPIPPPRLRTEDPDYLRWHGQAMGQVAAARAMIVGLIQEWQEHCERDTFTLEGDMRFWLCGREVLNLCWNAMQETFFRTAGSGEIRPGTRIGRYYRDLSQMYSHTGYVTLTAQATQDLTRLHFGLLDGSEWLLPQPNSKPAA